MKFSVSNRSDKKKHYVQHCNRDQNFLRIHFSVGNQTETIKNRQSKWRLETFDAVLETRHAIIDNNNDTIIISFTVCRLQFDWQNRLFQLAYMLFGLIYASRKRCVYFSAFCACTGKPTKVMNMNIVVYM